MSQGLGLSSKREALKGIIRDLHRGMAAQEAKNRFIREVGDVTPGEIAEMEQELIDEGMEVEQIKQFCNVHALVFEDQLRRHAQNIADVAHPVSLFTMENREIEKLTARIREAVAANDFSALQELLSALHGVDLHYQRKEQVLFPYLERHGFKGPSTVMWGKHNDIRELLEESVAAAERAASAGVMDEEGRKTLDTLLEEVDGMITKEENILFPASLERLTEEEWVEVLKQSDAVGYAFIEVPPEVEFAIRDLAAVQRMQKLEDQEAAAAGEASGAPETVRLSSGSLTPVELEGMLNTLPVDITFVGADDRVRYFSQGPDRIFLRTKAIIGRLVQDCHPPQSIDAVQKILDDFRSGARSSERFWIRLNGSMVLIEYFAVRDGGGRYLGALEVSQRIDSIRELTGEKRLADR